jgi:hypothetical protein
MGGRITMGIMSKPIVDGRPERNQQTTGGPITGSLPSGQPPTWAISEPVLDRSRSPRSPASPLSTLSSIRAI